MRKDFVPLKMVPLAELVDFRRGLTYKKSDEVVLSSNAVLRANNVDLETGSLDLTDIRFISDAVPVPASKKILKDSLLICTASGSRSHLGKIAYVEDDFDYAFGGFMGLVVPGAQVLGKFLYYFTRSTAYSSFIDSLSAGANINNLRFSDLGRLLVPFPQLDEQKRIVAVLDQAFAALGRARAHAEANLVDAEHMADVFLDEQVVSLITEFGRIRIGAVAEVKGGKRLPRGEKPGVEKTPYPYITVRDMNEAGTISSEKVGFISEAAQRTIQRYTISSADIYISIAGTIGKTGVVPESLNGANLTENAAKLVLSSGWLKDFVYWSTRSSDFRAQMIDQTRTAAQPKLALQRLGAITIPNADRKSQSRIVENMVRFRDEVGVLKSAYEAKITNIANLRQSLLQKAFSGQLT